jgi:hypothetical protein
MPIKEEEAVQLPVREFFHTHELDGLGCACTIEAL